DSKKQEQAIIKGGFMTIGSRYPTLARRWFALLAIVSVSLVIVTFASYAFQGAGPATRILFLVGLGGETSIGAWWSGMLLLLASVVAFDGFLNCEKPRAERRAWLALAVALFMLSFDEVASLHEFLANTGRTFLIPPALIGAGLVGYSVYQLNRSRVGWRIVGAILAAFGLLATIPVQEVVQHSVVWDDPVIYVMRAFIADGIELGAMLLLIFATRGNTAALLETGDALGAAQHYRRPLIVSAAVLLPILTAATFVLPYPGGPADWLAAVIYLFCALHLTRSLLLGERSFGAGAWLLLAFYLAGSVLSNSVNVAWDPV